MALRREGVLSRLGPALHPELPGEAPATHDPDLEISRLEKNYLVFIHLSEIYMYSPHLFHCL